MGFRLLRYGVVDKIDVAIEAYVLRIEVAIEGVRFLGITVKMMAPCRCLYGQVKDHTKCHWMGAVGPTSSIGLHIYMP